MDRKRKFSLHLFKRRHQDIYNKEDKLAAHAPVLLYLIYFKISFWCLWGLLSCLWWIANFYYLLPPSESWISAIFLDWNLCDIYDRMLLSTVSYCNTFMVLNRFLWILTRSIKSEYFSFMHIDTSDLFECNPLISGVWRVTVCYMFMKLLTFCIYILFLCFFYI